MEQDLQRFTASITEFLMNQDFFHFRSHYFKQCSGLPMDSKIPPYLQTFSYAKWKKIVDNVFAIIWSQIVGVYNQIGK